MTNSILNKGKKSLLEELENYQNEVGALKRAVESKSAAISILRNELELCQNERDKFKLMAENQTIKISNLRDIDMLKSRVSPERINSSILNDNGYTLAQLLTQSKEENKQLKIELTELKCRLHDAHSDLKVLREEKYLKTDMHHSRLSATTNSHLAQQERETLLEQLETLSSKCQILEVDLRCLLEEREELIKERDETKHKLHRLNHMVNVLLSLNDDKENDTKRSVDIDAIIMENRYLQQRMKQLKEEKTLALSNASRYKNVLEKCHKNQGGGKIGSPQNVIISPKQVSEFLKQCQGEVEECVEGDLRSLCAALVDSLNQKSRIVKTQRAANKMLARRMDELERRLIPGKNIEDGNILVASSVLMDGYVLPSGNELQEQVPEEQIWKLVEVKKRNSAKTFSNNINDKIDQSSIDKIDQSSIDDKIDQSSIDDKIDQSSIDDKIDQPSIDYKIDQSSIDDKIMSKCIQENSTKENKKRVSLTNGVHHVIDSSSHQPYHSLVKERTLSSESDIEEVITLDELDSYILKLKGKRRYKNKSQNDDIHPTNNSDKVFYRDDASDYNGEENLLDNPSDQILHPDDSIENFHLDNPNIHQSNNDAIFHPDIPSDNDRENFLNKNSIEENK